MKIALALVGLATVALISFGVVNSHASSTKTAQTSAQTPGQTPGKPMAQISDQQRILCEIAFNNGSGTKFETEEQFVEACSGLFQETAPEEDEASSVSQ